MLLRPLILIIYGKKLNTNTKITDIGKKIVGHDHSNKYISTLEFNRLSAKNFAARLKQADLATKVNTDSLVWKISFNNKLKKLNKRLLQIKQNI